MSSKQRQRSQNESAFAGNLTETNRYSSQKWIPMKSNKTPAPAKSVQTRRQMAQTADNFDGSGGEQEFKQMNGSFSR